MVKEITERLKVVKELNELFKFERRVYLVVTLLSLVMLITSAISLMIKDQAGTAVLSMLFGSSGLITYTAGRLLYMWSEALKRLIPNNVVDG